LPPGIEKSEGMTHGIFAGPHSWIALWKRTNEDTAASLYYWKLVADAQIIKPDAVGRFPDQTIDLNRIPIGSTKGKGKKPKAGQQQGKYYPAHCRDRH